jgi:DNA-binding transcriptional regulator YiaG
MDGTEIKQLRKSIKMSRREFGIEISRILGLDKPIIHTTIYRWEAGKCKPHDMFIKGIELVKHNLLNNK